MSTNDTFLAVFLGSKTSPKWAAWHALPEAERRAKEQQGMAAWKAWVEKHQGVIVAMGGPLGKTKKVDASGIADCCGFGADKQLGVRHSRDIRPGPLHGAAGRTKQRYRCWADRSLRPRGNALNLNHVIA